MSGYVNATLPHRVVGEFTAKDHPVVGNGLLANMSARPRTSIERSVPPARREWIAFGPIGKLPRLDAAFLQRLDEHWEARGFTGAFLMHLSSAVNREGIHATNCRDDLLTLNVLLRTRGTLLLAKAPLIRETCGLDGLTLLTDDPRLVGVTQ